MKRKATNENIRDLPNDAYIYRYKQIVFNDSSGLSSPQRKEKNVLDEFDIVFDSKEEFEDWYKGLVVGLAELDEVMNYCKFFKRIKGNEGIYERDGKTCLVNGKWDVYHINTKELADFKNFLIKNNWLNNWFELMDRYKKYV
jgi:hypothetical protein